MKVSWTDANFGFVPLFFFCLHALLQSSVSAAIDTSYATASAEAD